MTRSPMIELEIGGSHREIGYAIGRQLGTAIHLALADHTLLHECLLPEYRTRPGRVRYETLVDMHRASFPAIMDELVGTAEAAEVPFEYLFLINLQDEFLGPIQATAGDAHSGCTDCLVMTSGAALIGHNEDGMPQAQGHTVLLHVQTASGWRFTALWYAGFLPGYAFGFNQAGIVCTIDTVFPLQKRLGLAKTFLARSVLDAGSLEDAIGRATVPGRAGGCTYNLASVRERSIINLEVAPSWHHQRQVDGWLVHSNHYTSRTGEDQLIKPSSERRLARARAFCEGAPPTNQVEVLALMGDEADRDYPIYRTANPPDPLATLCTALFDLDAAQLHVYPGHPTREVERCTTVALPAPQKS